MRVDGTPGVALAAVRAAAREIDPQRPVLDLPKLDEQVERLNAQELLFARLSAFSGTLALAMASTGLYGHSNLTLAAKNRIHTPSSALRAPSLLHSLTPSLPRPLLSCPSSANSSSASSRAGV